jgi:hypothetical protein
MHIDVIWTTIRPFSEDTKPKTVNIHSASQIRLSKGVDTVVNMYS